MESLTANPAQQPREQAQAGTVRERERSLQPRVLGSFGDPSRGATLVCVAGLHGNEPSGVEALAQVFDRLTDEDETLSGRIVGLSGNRQALLRKCRYVDRDLNRIWRRSELRRVREGASPRVAEDEELLSLEREIQAVLEEARGDTFLLDLHSTSGPGPAFVVFEDTLPNRQFALAFPVTLVLGLEEELGGTLSRYVAGLGVTTVGFEAGQHDEPAAVERAVAAIWIALEAAGIVAPGRLEAEEARMRFEKERREVPHVVEVRYRHPVLPGDGFRMEPGFVSFEEIDAGTRVASDRSGPIAATQSGRILMPLYQEQGEDGFFVVRPVRPAWLGVSAVVRRLRLERFVHWLPGVKRDPADPGTFEVDTRVARWRTLELFHLLGFRRVAQDERWLRMRRRRYDD